MELKLKNNIKTEYTQISNIFIDQYIKGVNHGFITVYLIIMRCVCGELGLDTQTICEVTGLLESDVINALKFWNDKGVLSLEMDGDSVKAIEVIDLNMRLNMERARKKAALEIKNELGEKKEIKPITDRAEYTNEEIDCICKRNKDISFILKKAEEAYGTLLNVTERNVVVSIIDWLKLPVDVVALLITYCSGKNSSFRYLEKVAIEWQRNGIDTEEKAVKRIELFGNEFRVIMNAYGIVGREPTDGEQDYMKKWVNVYKLPMDLIKLACSRTIENIGKVSFRYTDKILSDWFEAGAKDFDDIKRLDDAHNAKKNVQNNTNHKYTPNNRFVNYTQREVDSNKMRELEKKMLENDIKSLGGNK